MHTRYTLEACTISTHTYTHVRVHTEKPFTMILTLIWALSFIANISAMREGDDAKADVLNENVYFSITGCILALVLGAYLYYHFVKKDGANHSLLFTVFLNVVDFATDMVYSIQLNKDYRLDKSWLLVLFLFSLVSSAAMSFAYVLLSLKAELKDKKFAIWFRENRTGATAISFLGVLSVELMNLFHSRLFGWKTFRNARENCRARRRLFLMLGIVASIG